MEPGPEMDLAVAKAVGMFDSEIRGSALAPSVPACWIDLSDRLRTRDFSPSTRVADAMEALEATGMQFEIVSARCIPEEPERWFYVVVNRDGRQASPVRDTGAGSASVAACRAILEWSEWRGAAT